MKDTMLVDIFKIDKIKKQMVLFKEPFMRDTIIPLDDKELNLIMKKYEYFKYREDKQEAVFGQDMFDESIMSYHIRRRFKREYASYYAF